ncbi:glycosyltransferase family 32 protein [Chryseobacterium taihuense]|uniref:Glycosyltransferase sugar-binding region containing DXD motif-containing protein n=1 Tax=Chryseobacterium taihuense TaxID=1141221 RepID=A0ABY0QTP7_9FLAO|nr:glycosyltransferase [Chryseobacterium taihuense]SDL86403.1 Glycosyltransferase sugar-binding region containing DXD motif-containing protein [Chryseobacterium taihuense]
MIPKIIHYCWFGGNEKSEKIKFCMESWEKYLPDYEVKEWNESNFPINKHKYVQQAYSEKKWAFVTDYVRAYALFEEGGIYLDTDVEVTGNLDVFLNHGAFSGFESKGYPFTALWGARKGHYWPKKVLNFYDTIEFVNETNTVYVSRILESEFGINSQSEVIQNFENDIFIYPSNYFCLNIRNYAIHHFEGSWVPSELKNDVNRNLINLFTTNNFIKEKSFKQCVNILLKEYNVSALDLLKFSIKKYLFK